MRYSATHSGRLLANRQGVFLIGVLLGIFGVYLYHLAPSVPSQGDAGELITVAYTLGINHPPGYPVHELLGFLFTKIPYGSIAWRVNLLSAVSHVLALFFLYLGLAKILKSKMAALGGALALGFSYTFWLYSEVAEVFSLNDLLVAILFYLTVTLFTLKPKDFSLRWPKILAAAGLVLGLGLANHLTVVFILPGLAYLLYPQFKKEIRKVGITGLIRPMSLIGGAILLGLLPYLFLLYRARTAIMPVAWVYPENLTALAKLMLRTDYGTFSPMAGANPALVTISDKAGQLSHYLSFFIEDFTYLGILLFLVGLAVGWKYSRRFTLFVLISFLISGPLFLTYANFPLTQSVTGVAVAERFYLLPNLFASLLIGVGLDFLFGLFAKLKSGKIVAWATVICLTVVLYNSHAADISQRGNFLDENFGRNILAAVPPKSLIVLQGDIPTFAAFYLRYVENFRPDVEFLTENQTKPDNNFRYLKKVRPDLILGTSDTASQAGIIMKNASLVPIYSYGPPVFALPGMLASPSGVLFSLTPKDKTPNFAPWQETEKGLDKELRFPTQKDVDRFGTLGDLAIFDYYARTFVNLGDNCRINNEPQCALNYYQKSLVYSPDLLPTHYSLAVVYKQMGQCSEAEKEYNLVLSLNPRAFFLYQPMAELYKDCFRDPVKSAYYEKLGKASKDANSLKGF